MTLKDFKTLKEGDIITYQNKYYRLVVSVSRFANKTSLAGIEQIYTGANLWVSHNAIEKEF